MRRRTHHLAVVYVLVLIPLAFGGCGGDENTAARQEQPRLTREQLVERLGDICQEHTDLQVVKREQFGRKHGIPSPEKATLQEYEREIVEVMLPIVRDTIHDIEQLRPPRGEEAKLDAFIKALKGAVATTQAHPNELAEDAGEEPFHPARVAAAALGAYYCGQA